MAPATTPTNSSAANGYERLTPTAVIVWLVDPLFPDLDRLHAIFELRERDTHALFGEQLSIHVLQLSALPPVGTKGYDSRVERWARFLAARDDAELDQLAAEDPIMALAKQTLERLSVDPEVRRLARDREEAILLHRVELATSRRQGETRGRADALLKLLGLRFGSTPAEVRARVDGASHQQLEVWLERVLTATTLDEVVAA